jgi:TldD protein
VCRGRQGWELIDECDFLDAAERVANEAVENCTAKPLGASGLPRPDPVALARLPDRCTEIIAHATEVDRVVGYEANYAGTSFVKLSDVGKLKYGSKHLNVVGRQDVARTRHGRFRRRRREDDEVGHHPRGQAGRVADRTAETRHYMGENFSRGCTFGNSWRDYPVPADA